MICFTVYAWPFSSLFIYFTNWTLLIQTWSVLLSIKAASDLEFKNKLNGQYLHHFLYTISIIFNFVTVTVYWTLIHQEIYQEFKDNFIALTQQQLVHSLPAVVCFINTLLTNSVLSLKLLKPILIIGAFYLFINFIATKYKGIPLYSFLDWKSSESFVIASGMLFSFGAVYFVLCKIDEGLKHDSLILKTMK